MLPELPEHVIREAFENRDVKMDGFRVGRNDTAVPNAEVCLYAAYAEEERQASFIYADDNLLIIRKPAGMSCEEDAKGGKTVALWVCESLRKSDPAAQPPLLCHRLDNQTEGLLLLATNNKTQDELVSAFAHRQIHKGYICLVCGTPEPSFKRIEAYLYKDAAHGKVHIANKPGTGALRIVTEYKVLTSGEVSRLHIVLHTGRTHQIRAQMAAIGHPLVGDDLYGDRVMNRRLKAKRLMLCATDLSFSLTGALAYMNEKHIQIEPRF